MDWDISVPITELLISLTDGGIIVESEILLWQSITIELDMF